MNHLLLKDQGSTGLVEMGKGMGK
ncbi:hypothetical protein NC653_021508 [Populus alba x Populus x berolinensis]|uniref:Uncharacterized protein n=1 Tax=Populus alba x Populus x berolinensis TaxID=444605 RepID=A0AAD6MN40_9ROSI|nr:hypothetical protein NC653_021499 [Populus alba x Populus x berolinensis]KAJ6988609.1 hypothetical protein NC653_021508 [Populus alba x Populus x berolinensis]